MTIRVKRAYEPPSDDDGYRVLVDRVWPRGVSKDALRIELWLKELAPSTELRQWFDHDPERWSGFVERYRAELADQAAALAGLIERVRSGETVTLVYGAREERYNNAVALRDFLAAAARRRRKA